MKTIKEVEKTGYLYGLNENEKQQVGEIMIKVISEMENNKKSHTEFTYAVSIPMIRRVWDLSGKKPFNYVDFLNFLNERTLNYKLNNYDKALKIDADVEFAQTLAEEYASII